jgi:hypothetical protein
MKNMAFRTGGYKYRPQKSLWPKAEGKAKSPDITDIVPLPSGEWLVVTSRDFHKSELTCKLFATEEEALVWRAKVAKTETVKNHISELAEKMKSAYPPYDHHLVDAIRYGVKQYTPKFDPMLKPWEDQDDMLRRMRSFVQLTKVERAKSGLLFMRFDQPQLERFEGQRVKVTVQDY